MNNQEKLSNAVQAFKSSDQTTKDYIEFMIVVKNVMSQGSGLLWTDVEKVLNEALNEPELSQWEQDWNKYYPTFEVYMLAVDEQLESICGLGHEHLPDFMWMDAYEEYELPNDVAKAFYKSHLTIY